MEGFEKYRAAKPDEPQAVTPDEAAEAFAEMDGKWPDQQKPGAP